MAYDEAIAERIRDLIGDEPFLTEQRMFGGLGFLIAGNMAIAASSKGGIMVRVDPTDALTLIESTAAYAMEMRGRTMRGWLHVDGADLHTKRQLAPWVRRAVSYAASLPPKT